MSSHKDKCTGFNFGSKMIKNIPQKQTHSKRL